MWTFLKYGSLILAVLSVSLWLHNMRVDSLETKWTKKVADAVAAQVAICTESKVYLKGAQNALQSRLNGIADSYVRLLETRCNVRTAEHTGGDDGAAGADGSAGGLTLIEKRLNDEQAARLESCQGLVIHIYTANHQADLLPPVAAPAGH